MFSSNTSQVSSGGYEIQRSLRFNQADDNYLNRTPASAGTRTTWTWSAWIKRATISDFQYSLFNAGTGIPNYDEFRLTTADKFRFFVFSSGSVVLDLVTTQVFRDPSAWYHFVIAYDSTQATASNRCKLYINGVQVTAFDTATYPAQNTNTTINNNVEHTIGRSLAAGFEYNGYMTEVNFIDGQALTPASFGAYDAQTGVWGPTPYGGSYGTNGFYLNFSDNSNTTAATLGKDYSGNSNNWTPNNFSVAAGAGNDSLVDVPTNFGTDTGVGGTVRGNYCTLNPINTVGANTFSNGNLDVSIAGGQVNLAIGTLGVSSGKWYWEVVPTSGADGMIGIADASATASNASWRSANGWTYYADGSKYNNLTGVAYGASYTTSDVIGVALDMDAGTLTFYKNNASQGVAYSVGISGKTISPMLGNGSNGVAQQYTANFGQRPFAYTAPSGFKALNTQNLPTPTIGATTATQAGKFFNPVLWTGNGSVPRAITGLGFQPDFVWGKARSIGFGHILYDSVRGTGTSKSLISSSTDAEGTASSNANISSFDADGFTIGVTSSTNVLNDNGYTFVGWGWKANGAGVTNTAGSITSTVSANTTSGFSVVTFTGVNAGATVGHGLGSAPQMIIMKARNAADNWYVYHVSIGAPNYLVLNSTVAAAAAGVVWNNTTPTSSVFSIGNNTGTATQVAYCFSEIPGYSRFGSYTGNGSTDGPFVFTGMRPAYVMLKRSDATSDWWVYDTKRGTFNAVNNPLYANGSFAEDPGPSVAIDILSNGFKLRSDNGTFNGSGGTYIFMALAEAPQKFALAR